MSGSLANTAYLAPPSGNPPGNTDAMTKDEALSASFLTMLEGHRALLYQIIRTYCPEGLDGGSMNKKHLLQLQEIEEQLAGYGLDDFV